MLWVFLSVLSGLGDAVSFGCMRKLHKLDASVKIALYSVITLPFLPLGFLFYGIPKAPLDFYFIVAVNAMVWSIALFLLMKSLEESDLSASIPILSFTPVFLLLASYILLGEFPGIQGLAGIFIVVAGSCILNMPSVKSGYLGPVKSVFFGKGLLMLAVAFLFSITASLAKSAIHLSNPAYFIFVHYLFTSLLLTALFFSRIRKSKKQIMLNLRQLLAMGAAVAFSEIMISIALMLTLVSYAVSLKRTSVVFSVLIGFFFLKEKNFKPAIIGSAIMFAGALMIALA